MFYKPKNAIYKSVSRRRFMELGGSAVTMLGTGALGIGMNSTMMSTRVQAQSSDDAK